MTRREIEVIVALTMNQLEHEYDIEGMENLGRPTIEEIATRILKDWDNPDWTLSPDNPANEPI